MGDLKASKYNPKINDSPVNGRDLFSTQVEK
jgi:hypothetical protein